MATNPETLLLSSACSWAVKTWTVLATDGEGLGLGLGEGEGAVATDGEGLGLGLGEGEGAVATVRSPQETRPPALLWTRKAFPCTAVAPVLFTAKQKLAAPAAVVLLYRIEAQGSELPLVK